MYDGGRLDDCIYQLRAYARHRASRRSIHSALGRQPGMPRQAHCRYRPTLEDRLCWAIDVERALARLTPRLRIVLDLTVLCGGTDLHAAHRIGVSARTAVRLKRCAIERLAAMPEFDR